ncbi:MAG: WYL domain-containing protein [Actinomycetota bacterium]|nr:WYL domain-containing protein [Actinomycetota bacterium]
MRRIERLINLIAALLETLRPMTAEEIRERIGGYDQPNHEAFRRAFERDKEALRAMGIPLEVVPTDPYADQADGYIITKARYYLPQLDLEPDELTALRLASDALLGSGEDAGSGLLKLSIDAPIGPLSGPRFTWGADLAAEEPVLGPVYSALVDRRGVQFSYESGGGQKSFRRVEPFGIVHRRGRWYLVGRDVDRESIRSFRLSRIAGDLETVNVTYEIPEGFDAAEHVSAALEIQTEAPTTAVVRFDARMRWWPEQNMASNPSTEVPGGALDVEMIVGNVEALVSWVLGFGEGLQVVSPSEARAALVEHLRPLVQGR